MVGLGLSWVSLSVLSPKVLGSSSLTERDSHVSVLNVLPGLGSFPGSPQKVVLASPADSLVCFALSLALVRQDVPQAENSFITSRVSPGASLSLTLSKPLFLYMRKPKVLKSLSLCSPRLAWFAFSHPTKDLCGWSTLELRMDEAQVSSSAMVSLDFFQPSGCFSPSSDSVR
jgi:hypothetical protein